MRESEGNGPWIPMRRRSNSGVVFDETVTTLLSWYRRHARDLPWRRAQDPYGIWVSEIMLQQTQVKTVIPYWERWMREWPTVLDLAGASEARVLKLWEGLGYYRRARHLLAAARMIRDRHQGRFPEEHDAILALPGVGRYTAGAIGSIAFGRAVPVLDGNIVRVFCRWGGRAGDPKGAAMNRELWAEACRWVEAAARIGGPQGCSHVNQGLMELGATVCTPRAPRCVECPLAAKCRAHGEGRAEAYPEVGLRLRTESREYVVAVIESKGKFLRKIRLPRELNWVVSNMSTSDWSV